MSSTNEIDARITKIFNEHVVKNNGKKYLLTAIDKNAATYYEDPKHPAQAYFSFIDTSSQESLAAYFSKFWNEMGSEEFAGIANDLSEVAFKLSADAETQSEEVSSFIYTMY